MANKRFWLGMLVMALVFGLTVVGLTSCDIDLLSQEGSFTMIGSELLKKGGDYQYVFQNYSKYDVKITIDDVTHTITKRDKNFNGTRFELYNSSKTITVTYSPSNSVRYKSPGTGFGIGRWEDTMEVEFWDR